jgi:ABC-type multidrug transport system ATPase subunit
MLKKLREHKITVIVSTPYMDEAMRCDRVALMQEGKILSIDTPETIKDSFSRKLFRVRAAEKYKLIKALRSYPATISAFPFGDAVHVTFRENDPGETIYNFLAGKGINDASISEAQAGIEDRFLELMEKEGAAQAKEDESLLI